MILKIHSFFPLVALASLLIFFGGCKSPDTVAYKTIGTTEALVDAAMKGWGDYVAANKEATWLPAQENLVREIYIKYRSSVNLLYATRLNAKEAITASDTEAISTIADQLLVTIRSFKGDPKK